MVFQKPPIFRHAQRHLQTEVRVERLPSPWPNEVPSIHFKTFFDRLEQINFGATGQAQSILRVANNGPTTIGLPASARRVSEHAYATGESINVFSHCSHAGGLSSTTNLT